MKKPLPTRRLGASDLHVSSIGLGLMSLSGVYGKSADDDGIALIRDAIDEGVNFLDSADMYGWGQNETLLGKALEGRRERVVVATKFGQVKVERRQGRRRPARVRTGRMRGEPRAPRCRHDRPLLRAPHRPQGADRRHGRRDGPAGRSKARCATSDCARRARPRCAAPTPCIRSRRCRPNIRCCIARRPRNRSGRRANSASRSSPIRRSAAACSPARCAIRRNSPTTGGATIRASRRRTSSAIGSWSRASRRSPTEKRCTPGQLALAWLLAQGEDIVPIPGTKRIERVRENLGALDVRLSADDLRRLSEAIPPGAAAGTRYPAGDMKGVHL